MLSEKTKTLLNYVPSAVFPALIFPAVLLENSGSFVSYDDPKIIAIIIAMLVGYFSRKIILKHYFQQTEMLGHIECPIKFHKN